ARVDHRREAVASVGPGGVNVEVAPQVLEFEQVREFAGCGRFDLSPALAELWWHVGQAQARVDLLLGGAGQPFASGSVLARLPSGEMPFLVEVPSPSERELLMLDVVLLGAREVQDSGPDARLLHRPKAPLQAAMQLHARLGSSLAKYG